MIFILDENFPKGAVPILKQKGHKVIDVRDMDIQGQSDEIIFESAQKENAVLLTTDNDFFHTIPHIYTKHCGVVVIALRQPNRKNILEKISWILDHIEDFSFDSKAYLLRDNSFIEYPK
jgi:predicted nuclease of predicted toxin-antitoxin system